MGSTMSTLVIADETPGGKTAAKFKADGKRKSDEHKFWWLVGASLRTDTLLVSQEDEHRLNFKLPGGDVCSTDSLDAVNDYLRVSERKRRICTSSRSGPTEVQHELLSVNVLLSLRIFCPSNKLVFLLTMV
jgi:hypothetical protein